ncbi:MAG: HipA family kinase [Thiolinea sp.]
MNTPQITQVIRRSDQGATRPFVCRADDGYVYYVKGRSASTGERIREWMGTHLAQAFGLPVPPMRLLEVPSALYKSLDTETARDLGHGYAVGSRQVQAVSELRFEEIPLIPANTQQAILLFDYWVQNEDRTLSSLGGNPNLLLNKATSALFAIDYNLILPGMFDAALFWQTHVFRHVFRQPVEQAQQQQFVHQMQQALSQWETAWQQLPDEWLEENEASKVFDETAIKQRLEYDQQGAIWRHFHP